MANGIRLIRLKLDAAHLIACLLILSCSGMSASPLKAVGDDRSVTLVMEGLAASPIRVFALPPHQDLDAEQLPVYEGKPGTVRLPRQQINGDLLYQRFIVTDRERNIITGPVWVSDVGALPKLRNPMPWPTEIKGVSNPEDYDDLVALGVKHVHVNVILRTLLLPDRAPDPPAAFIREVNGHTIRLNPQAIREWDAKLKRMTDDGINVVAVLLNRVDENASNDDLLVHPDTDIAGAPHKLAAFSLDSDRAVASYIGAVGFLAERYSRPDKQFGWIGGYIVGNEVDSHWVWHNMGPADLETVAGHYIQEVRLCWLAVREQARSPRVFVSLTHSWDRPNAADPMKSLSGKALLNRLTQLSREQGDFGWEVAYHPYPQNLFQPRFWDDRMAMFGYDSPMITFKNMELLPAYLDRPEMQFEGKPRRIIFSEQGLHTPKEPDGERIQAAALALALHRTKHTPGIDAFILHRHIDSRHEGGLLLGLRHPNDPDRNQLGGKKQSWEVFQQFETPGWEDKARFALEVAGFEGWSEAEPKPGPFPDEAPEWSGIQRYAHVIFDPIKQLSEAEIENALAVQRKIVNLPDGGFVEAIMLHPLRPNRPHATASYDVALPDDSRPVLRFKTFREKAQGDGVVFLVRVNNQVVFRQTVEDRAMLEHEVDLSQYAGETIRLTLEVDPRNNNRHDTALWLNPAITNANP